MKSALSAVDEALDSWAQTYRVSEKGLSLFRILFASTFVLWSGPRLLWAIGYPDFFWSPPRPLASFDCGSPLAVCGFPAPEVVWALELTVAAAALCLLFGYKTPWASIILTLALLATNQFRYSFGKIDHDIIFVVTPAVMALSGWGRHYSIDSARGPAAEEKRYPTRCLTILALVIAAGFLSAGYPKAEAWMNLNLGDSGVRGWVTSGYFVNGRDDWLLPSLAYTYNPYLWEALDYAGVIFELCLALSVIHGKSFRGYLFVAVFFHATNYLILNISFWFHLPVYAAFLPWDQVAQQLARTRWDRWLRSQMSFRKLALVGCLCLPVYFAGPSRLLALATGAPVPDDLHAVVVYPLAIAVCAYLLIAKLAPHRSAVPADASQLEPLKNERPS